MKGKERQCLSFSLLGTQKGPQVASMIDSWVGIKIQTIESSIDLPSAIQIIRLEDFMRESSPSSASLSLCFSPILLPSFVLK